MASDQVRIADGLVADAPDALRKAVREEIKYGSDWIKVLVTGAFMSVGDNPANVRFSEEELRAVVEEANRRGVPVMVHAHAAEGIKMAVGTDFGGFPAELNAGEFESLARAGMTPMQSIQAGTRMGAELRHARQVLVIVLCGENTQVYDSHGLLQARMKRLSRDLCFFELIQSSDKFQTAGPECLGKLTYLFGVVISCRRSPQSLDNHRKGAHRRFPLELAAEPPVRLDHLDAPSFLYSSRSSIIISRNVTYSRIRIRANH